MPKPKAPSHRKRPALNTRKSAAIFAALGDETRLALITQLSRQSPLSISALSESSALTRQAITKHLRVLEHAGLVHRTRQGRETRFKLHPQSLTDARQTLDLLAAQWDDALARLKTFVESSASDTR